DADQPLSRQRRRGRAAHPATLQLGVCLESRCTPGDRRSRRQLSHQAAMGYGAMNTLTRYRALGTVLCVTALASCDKNAGQVLPSEPPLSSRVKFFNFGIGAPGVNFYANGTKMTAISSGTSTESTTGVAYGGVGNGGAYSTIAPGTYTLTGRIAATIDKNLAIATVDTTIADGKFYSLYMCGFYNAAGKVSDAFVLEDAYPSPVDYAVAQVRFVHVIPNAAPLTLYAANTITF